MRFLEDLSANLRFAFRMLWRNPGPSLIAILCLAVGIGAGSAMFSLIYALWVDPYPYRDAGRMLNFSFVDQQGREGTMAYSLADYLDLKRSASTLEDVAAREGNGRKAVVTSGLPESVNLVLFSPNSFDYFGVPAMLGRTWHPNDIPQPAAPPRIAVLSYLFWTRYFNSDRGIVGKTIDVDRQPYTIIGVAPPRFTWNDADVYIPLAITPDPKHFVLLMAHVKKGIRLDAVDSELQSITERFARRSPENYPKGRFRMRVQTLNDYLLSRFGQTLKILMAAVILLLFISCANVSILLLARATARQQEIAIRLAIGGSKARILGQLLTESVVLSVTGGLLGVLLAYRSVPAIVGLMPQYSVPHEAVIAVNGPVVLITFAISVLTGILFGMAPAWQLASADVNQAVQGGGRGSSGTVRGGRMRNVLIAGEIALTIVLLVSASVAIRSFATLNRVPLGYHPEHVLSMNINLPPNRYTTWETRNAVFERIVEQLRALPGVRSATLTETATPPYIGFTTGFEIAGQPKPGEQQQLHVGLVGSQYFATVGIPLVRGRLLSADEIDRNAHLAVINEELARRYFWPDRDPLGARISVPGLKLSMAQIFTPPEGDQTFEVIGIVGDARNRGLEQSPEPAIYVPYKMATVPGANFMLKTEVDPNSVVRAARERIRALDPDLPVGEVMTLEDALNRFAKAYPRFSTTLFSIFAAVGLLLAATGLYSVVSYTVAQRTQEFGIRMALGAERRHVVQAALSSIGKLIAIGTGVGLLGSVALSRVIARYIENWNPHDPVAYAIVVAVVAGMGVLACWIPAARAAGIEPMVALRHE